MLCWNARDKRRWKGKRKGTEKWDATVIFREKILDEFQPLGFKQESVRKNWMSCDKTMACFTDEQIAKHYFKKCLPNRIEIILFLATLSFARETLGRVNQLCSSWNDSRSLYTDRNGSRMLPNSSELFGIKFLPVLRKIPLQRKMWTRLVFLQWKRYGLFSNPLIAFTFSTEFCDAKMNVYSFLFVCLCTRLEFSSHASVFCFCLLLFFTRS